mgnify:CR=1 FL=1
MPTVTIYDCCNQVFDPQDFAAHLQTAHQIDSRQTVEWQGVMFMDGSGFSVNVYTCTISGVTIKRTVTESARLPAAADHASRESARRSPKAKPMPDSKLKTKLRNGLAAAESNPGQPYRFDLPGGLRIDLKIDDSHTFLQLSRTTRPGPSDRELQTTLEHWPAPLPASVQTLMKDSKRFSHAGRYYLSLNWPTVESLPLDSTSVQSVPENPLIEENPS